MFAIVCDVKLTSPETDGSSGQG